MGGLEPDRGTKLPSDLETGESGQPIRGIGQFLMTKSERRRSEGLERSPVEEVPHRADTHQRPCG